MKKRSFLTSTLLATLLLTTNLTAQKNECVGDHCLVDLSKLSSPKTARKKMETFAHFTQVKFVDMSKDTSDEELTLASQNMMNEIEIFSLPKEKYYATPSEILEVDNNEIEIVALSSEKYIMTNLEKEVYYKNETLREEAEEASRILKEKEKLFYVRPMKKLDDKIQEQANPLPTSEFYCGKDKTPVYNKELEFIECA